MTNVIDGLVDLIEGEDFDLGVNAVPGREIQEFRVTAGGPTTAETGTSPRAGC
ncbi:hypothetical protein [Nonomuraea aridisoli]|uniref:hypothetical protein n=1 Tax=Nonomuraea aridisoli TaxID=2070368 RepID=UPI0015E8C535|nr:hypothetical protein [Nonomuraea aridisoli]